MSFQILIRSWTVELNNVFCVTGRVRSGLPPLQLPPFNTIVNNRTLDFFDMCYELGSSVVLVPVISVLGNIAIAKAFGKSVPSTLCPVRSCCMTLFLEKLAIMVDKKFISSKSLFEDTFVSRVCIECLLKSLYPVCSI